MWKLWYDTRGVARSPAETIFNSYQFVLLSDLDKKVLPAALTYPVIFPSTIGDTFSVRARTTRTIEFHSAAH